LNYDQKPRSSIIGETFKNLLDMLLKLKFNKNYQFDYSTTRSKFYILHCLSFKTEFEENYQNKLDNHQPFSSDDGIVISGFLTFVSGSIFTDLNGRFFLLRS